MNTLGLIALIVGYITTIIGFVTLVLKTYKNQKIKMACVIQANLCELRSNITAIYYHHVDEEEPTLREFERKNLDALFEGYQALGGNSFVLDIYEAMRHWKVTT